MNPFPRKGENIEQVKNIYDGVEDELGLAPHTQEIRQEALPSVDIYKIIDRERWLK